MTTKHLSQIRRRFDSVDPIVAERSRRGARIVLLVFLATGLIGAALIFAGLAGSPWGY